MIDKICPFMSCPIIVDGKHIGLARILCLDEKCMAWVEPCPPDKCSECVYAEIDDEPSNCIGKTGYCELIRREERP